MTDYWVNDQLGRPFFVISSPFTAGLLDMLKRDNRAAVVGRSSRTTLAGGVGG